MYAVVVLTQVAKDTGDIVDHLLVNSLGLCLLDTVKLSGRVGGRLHQRYVTPSAGQVEEGEGSQYGGLGDDTLTLAVGNSAQRLCLLNDLVCLVHCSIDAIPCVRQQLVLCAVLMRVEVVVEVERTGPGNIIGCEVNTCIEITSAVVGTGSQTVIDTV